MWYLIPLHSFQDLCLSHACDLTNQPRSKAKLEPSTCPHDWFQRKFSVLKDKPLLINWPAVLAQVRLQCVWHVQDSKVHMFWVACLAYNWDLVVPKRRFSGLHHCLCISRGKAEEFFPNVGHTKDLRTSHLLHSYVTSWSRLWSQHTLGMSWSATNGCF